ncbi:transglutaminase domain-containing protein [Kitasatospora sp. NPDC048365]|uniref:transglutaminase domain-containing protein n=1 Tax=Kitasatospora sp. NPDC048365 TaxID=3364050 RepID=UPI00371C9C03
MTAAALAGVGGLRPSVVAGAAAVLLVAVLVGTSRAGGWGRRVLGGLGLAVLAAVVAMAGAAQVPLPEVHGAVPRVAPPGAVDPATDPLDLVPVLAARGPQPAFRAVLAGALAQRPPRWVLLAYNSWTPDGGWSARPALGPVPEVSAAPDGGGTAAVTLQEAGVRLLPHPGGVRGAGVAGAGPAGLLGDAELEALYARGELPSYRVAVAAGGGGGRPVVGSGASGLPGCARGVLGPVIERVRGGGGAERQPGLLEAEFTGGTYLLDPAAGGGEGCEALVALAGGRGANRAQFATAFALAARELGFNARVVAGYRAVEPGPDGAVAVTAGDALAWAQIEYEGGWVDFDPVPGAKPISSGTPVPSASAPDDRTESVDVGGTGWSRELPWLLVLVAAVIVAAGARPVWRRVRLARVRRRGSAAQQVLAAWEEVARRIPGAGRDPSRTFGRTAAEVGIDPVGRLAALAERALYGGDAGAQQARQAWELSTTSRRALRRRARRRTVGRAAGRAVSRSAGRSKRG